MVFAKTRAVIAQRSMTQLHTRRLRRAIKVNTSLPDHAGYETVLTIRCHRQYARVRRTGELSRRHPRVSVKPDYPSLFASETNSWPLNRIHEVCWRRLTPCLQHCSTGSATDEVTALCITVRWWISPSKSSLDRVEKLGTSRH